MTCHETVVKLLVEDLHKLEDAHQVIDLDLDLELFEEELEPVDVLHVLDIGLQADVELEAWLDILHGEVVVRLALLGALGFEDHREEGVDLAVVVDLEPIEGRLED